MTSSVPVSASSFEQNWRRKQEIRLRPVANDIYQRIFGFDIGIERFEQAHNFMLDKEFAVDVRLTLRPSELPLSGQEKFLSARAASFRSITVEYYQNPDTGERGDWFKLCTDFYFVGYETAAGNTFDPWIMVNMPALKIATHASKIRWLDTRNQHDGAQASFRYCFMADIPTECIIAASWLNITPQPSQIRMPLL